MVMVVIRVGDETGGSYPVELLHCAACGEIDPAAPKVEGTIAAASLDAVAAAGDVNAAGAQLFTALTSSVPGAEWKALGARHAGDLRTVLDVAPVKLRRLPWEAMRDGQKRVFALQPFALGKLSGGAHSQHSNGERACSEALRVLIVVGCDPADKRVKWAEELRAVRHTLLRLGQAADDEVKHQPSVKELSDALKDFRPHVLHFIGHGTIDPISGAPALDLWGPAINGSLDADQIFLALGNAPRPRVVFLNACHAAEEEEAAFGVASAFQEGGVPAVVAMSGAVQGEAAALAAKHVYEALTAGRPLDDAVREARRQLAMHGVSAVQDDWWRPRVLVSMPPDRVLPPPPPRTAPPRFVDRKPPRRELLARIASATELDTGAVLAIVGDEGVGKTELMRWCLGACGVRGHLPAYVDLDCQPALDTLDVLDAIRKEVVSARPAAGDAFRPYLWAAEHLRNAREVPPLTESSAVPPSLRGTLQPGDENMVPRIFAAFREALAAAAKDRPITVGLDHPARVATGVVASHLAPHLLGPIQRGEVPRVIVVTATTRGELNALGLATVSHERAIDRFPPAEWRELAEDLVCVAGLQDAAAMILAFEAVQSGQPWKPSRLATLLQALVLS